MKRFLIFVGVAVVAAAMYVAASPASQQSKGPSEKQFLALQKKVTTLSKSLKSVKAEADAAVGVIGACYLTVSGNTATVNVLPVNQFGNTTAGFLFGSSTTNTPRTALDIDTATPMTHLQEVNSACLTGALRHHLVHSGNSLLQRWAEHTR